MTITVNVGETPCLVDNWMRIIFALVFVGGVDSATITSLDVSGAPIPTTKYIKDHRDQIRGGRACGNKTVKLVLNNIPSQLRNDSLSRIHQIHFFWTPGFRVGIYMSSSPAY